MMPDLDALAPNYLRAQQRWPDAQTLANSHAALVRCFAGEAHGMVEHVKSFIECVCITITEELSAPISSLTPSLTDLLIAALDPLGLRNTRGASKLDKVLSAFNRLSDALTEMRNDNGPLAHGKGAFVDALTADHARAFVHTGDAILGVLLGALEGIQPDLAVTREPYASFPHLNDQIDRAVTVEVKVEDEGERQMVVFSVATGPGRETIQLRVEPSRLLYGIDRSAYVEVLGATARGSAAPEDEDESAEEMVAPDVAATDPRSVEAPTAGAASEVGPHSELVASYAGALADLRGPLTLILADSGLMMAPLGDGGPQPVESLLATADLCMGVDWKLRAQLQARLKVSCKRVLAQFGASPESAEALSSQLVGWFREHAPESTEAAATAGADSVEAEA